MFWLFIGIPADGRCSCCSVHRCSASMGFFVTVEGTVSGSKSSYVAFGYGTKLKYVTECLQIRVAYDEYDITDCQQSRNL